ncbi:hypothetical protein SP058_00250 [Salmonella phage FSL SP-058]|uniref:Nucleotide modification associated domain-containing protein n=1 Tax=Salmonella phage FSL SP-058 TaxID=1173761 RepID=S4TSU4_9CAUD|nr:hypothetical protein SP058_00250 [Salmonella phage FSL SP-058]AGF88165.1 hypothetical protein SP058_00250 [Salmonella phage FSL SP-058]
MSVRLTNAARDEIVKAAVNKSGFPKRIKEARIALEDIKMECWIAAFGGLKAYRRLCDRFETIEEKISELRKSGVNVPSLGSGHTWSNSKLNLAGMQVPSPDMNWVSDKFKELRVIYMYDNKPTLTADNPLVQKFLDAEKALEDLKSSRQQIKDNVQAVVYSVSTTKRLIEVWPESAELIPREVEVVRAGLPAINFESLNASIGIPSEKK